MNYYKVLLAIIVLASPTGALAKVKISTTTTSLAAIAKEIGGNLAEVNSITRASQDPHYIEAKPSYIVGLRKADLVISIGLALENAWLPNLLRGARKPDLLPGQKGYLELGPLINPLGELEGKMDRSQGDVHPEGNPHFHLDPDRAIVSAELILNRLKKIDPKNSLKYTDNFQQFKTQINTKSEEWKKRISSSGVEGIVSYHKTLFYFVKFFGLKQIGEIESKPGIPPSGKEIVQLINKMKNTNTHCLLIENYFEDSAARKISQSVKISTQRVAVEVGSEKNTETYSGLIDHLVNSIENCGKSDK